MHALIQCRKAAPKQFTIYNHCRPIALREMQPLACILTTLIRLTNHPFLILIFILIHKNPPRLAHGQAGR